jgi:hypothetical protein
MGQDVSLPECNIPSRLLIGVENHKKILLSCSRHKVVYALGFALVVTIFLTVGYFMTRDEPDTAFKIPAWLIFVPPVLLILYSSNIYSNVMNTFSADQIEQQLSGMSKKDYLNYKIGDDRTSKSVFGTTTNAAILSGSNIMGPFLRQDR